MDASPDWSLDDATRADAVVRLASNMIALAFARGADLSEESAAAAAAAAEKKAYTTARVEARTTTGVRPAAETAAAYTRKLAELAIDVVKAAPVAGVRADGGDGGGAPADATTAAADGGDDSDHDLDLHGDREFLVAETAEEHLAAMLAAGAAHRKIRLSTKSFGAEAAAVAARALANVSSTLEHVNLADIIAGRPEDEALAALRTLADALSSSALHTLDLSDNALGEKGVRAFGSALTSQTGLRSLALLNVGASLHACAALAELLRHAGELRSLAFHNNMSGCEGASEIASLVARAPKLESFRMASSRVGPDGGAALAAALSAGGTSLTDLDLSDNPLGPGVGAPLAGLLGRHAGLTRLNLNDTGLTDEGVAPLAAALSAGAAPTLAHLELALNEITPVGARALGRALAGRPGLVRLNLRENELESAGAAAIAAGLTAAGKAAGPATPWALREVDACANQIRRKGAVALAAAVAGAPNLTLLALDENEISEDGVGEVEELLRGAGKSAALGPMDDNDADGDDEEEEEELEEEEDEYGDGGAAQDDGGLADAMAAARIA